MQKIWEVTIHDLFLEWELVPQAEEAASSASLPEFADSDVHAHRCY